MRVQRARSDQMAPSPRGERRGIQIGPRIRVGGTLGKIGEGIKRAVGSALPIALAAVPFAGPVISALKAIPGVGAIVDAVESAGGDVADVVSKIPGGDAVVNAVKSGAGSVEDLGKFLLDHKQDAVDALNVVNNVQRQQKSESLANDALSGAKARYDAQAPLRTAGLAGLQNPQANTPDLTALKAQGQAPSVAPMPVAAPRGNLANAQLAAGPQSGNPFATGLPVAPSPSPTPNGQLPPGLPVAPLPTAPRSVPPTPAQLQGPSIPAPFSPIPSNYAPTRQPGQTISPMPVASY